MEENNVVVIDNGSSLCKAGWSSETKPRSVFKTAVGKPNTSAFCLNDAYIGSEIQPRHGLLSLSSPILRGVVQNWDDMEQLWRHVFEYELEADPTGHLVLLTDVPGSPKKQRQKMAEIMFETFGVSGLSIAPPAVLSLFANSRHSALLVEYGDGCIHFLPMFKGYLLNSAAKYTKYSPDKRGIAGGDLTEFLRQLLVNKGFAGVARHPDLVQLLKHNFCFVSENSEDETSGGFQTAYELPGGRQVVNLDSERFLCPELAFTPSVADAKTDSIQEMIMKTILGCPIDTRQLLSQNIVFAGSGYKFRGFLERLRRELEQVSGGYLSFNLLESANSGIAAWTGGATFANMPFFNQFTLEKLQYEEAGFNTKKLALLL